jgi:hypothetical protein
MAAPVGCDVRPAQRAFGAMVGGRVAHLASFNSRRLRYESPRTAPSRGRRKYYSGHIRHRTPAACGSERGSEHIAVRPTTANGIERPHASSQGTGAGPGRGVLDSPAVRRHGVCCYLKSPFSATRGPVHHPDGPPRPRLGSSRLHSQRSSTRSEGGQRALAGWRRVIRSHAGRAPAGLVCALYRALP